MSLLTATVMSSTYFQRCGILAATSLTMVNNRTAGAGLGFFFSKGGLNLEGIGNESEKPTRRRQRRCWGTVGEGDKPPLAGRGRYGGASPPKKFFSSFGCFLLQSRHSSALSQGQDFSPKLMNRLLITFTYVLNVHENQEKDHLPERRHVFIFEIWQIYCKGKQNQHLKPEAHNSRHAGGKFV